MNQITETNYIFVTWDWYFYFYQTVILETEKTHLTVQR